MQALSQRIPSSMVGGSLALTRSAIDELMALELERERVAPVALHERRDPVAEALEQVD